MEAKICVLIFSMLFLGLYKMCNSDSGILKSDLLHRNRRQLLFLNQSFLQVQSAYNAYPLNVRSISYSKVSDSNLVTIDRMYNTTSVFNVGVGSPTPSKMVNVNWVIQAQFTLPWNRTLIPDDILDANSGYVGMSRGKRDIREASPTQEYENDAKLYHFYKYIEDTLNGYGHNGTSCILQAMCKLGAEPLETMEEEDLLHELASYILTPTNDLTNHAIPKEATVYIKAHEQGKNNEDCTKIYKDCKISLVDMFSYTFDSS